MEWLGNNWFWIVIVGGMIGMHLFGHRGHGSGHNHSAQPPDSDSGAARKTVPSVTHSHGEMTAADATDPQAPPPADPAAKPTIKHKHGC